MDELGAEKQEAGRRANNRVMTVKCFGPLLSGQLRSGNPALRRNHVRPFVSEVRVNDGDVVLGTQAALKVAIVTTGQDRMPRVPEFDRKWCRLQDSNL